MELPSIDVPVPPSELTSDWWRSGANTSPGPVDRVSSAEWPSQEDRRLWQSYQQTTARLLGQLDDDLSEAHSITLAEYDVLEHLCEADGWQLRMSDLASRCGLSPSGLTRRFDAMTRRGLVDRRRCEDDRRGVWATLTEKGCEIYTAAVPTHVTGVNDYFLDSLNVDHRAALAEAFGRISAAVRKGSSIVDTGARRA